MTKYNFVFVKEALEDTNADSDLFYDLTKGGYINPSRLLEDQELAKRVQDAADLVEAFLDAITDACEQ